MIFSLVLAANQLYRVQTVGLNPLQLVLVGTVLEVTAFIFEIPTGIVADLYSRRLSVIIGTFLFGIGFLAEASVPVFGSSSWPKLFGEQPGLLSVVPIQPGLRTRWVQKT